MPVTTTEASWPRILTNFVPEPNSGCHLWMGTVDRDGYGRFKMSGRPIRVHRAAWMLAHGPIPDGLTIDHKCRVTCCINTDHMELVTSAENQRRRWERRPSTASHCWRGHELVGANRYRGRPDCVACRRLRNLRARGTSTEADPASGPGRGQVYGRVGGAG